MGPFERRRLQQEIERSRLAALSKFRREFPVPWFVRIFGLQDVVDVAFEYGWCEGADYEAERLAKEVR